MEYPRYLSIGNWLFTHIENDHYYDVSVGGPRPENLYMVLSRYHSLDLGCDLRTYEGLIASGATEPSKEELLRLLDIKL